MVIGRLGGAGFKFEAALLTIDPDGKMVEQAIPFKLSSTTEVMKSYTAVRAAELVRINQLKAEGWVVDHTTSATTPNLYENTYLLKRP